jgi:ABC-type multidrug transport system fused ATPase/permease subunit
MKDENILIDDFDNLLLEFFKDNNIFFIYLIVLSLSIYIKAILIPNFIGSVNFKNIEINNLFFIIFRIIYYFVIYQIIQIFYKNKLTVIVGKWRIFIINKLITRSIDIKKRNPNLDIHRSFVNNTISFLYISSITMNNLWDFIPIILTFLSITIYLFNFDKLSFFFFVFGYLVYLKVIKNIVDKTYKYNKEVYHSKLNIVEKSYDFNNNIISIISANLTDIEENNIKKIITQYKNSINLYSKSLNLGTIYNSIFCIFIFLLIIVIIYIKINFGYNVNKSKIGKIILIFIFYFLSSAPKDLDKLKLCIVNFNKANTCLDRLNEDMGDNKINIYKSRNYNNYKNYRNELLIKNLYFKFDKKNIINNINLKLYESDILCLKGEIGKGKTTFLKIISGYIIQDKGTVNFNNILNDSENYQEWRNNIIYVEQFPKIFNKSTSYNLYYGKNINNNRIKQIIKELNLDEIINFIISNPSQKLSGGQIKMLHLIRILFIDKKIILLDEPTTSLDYHNIVIVKKIIKYLQKKKKIIIFSTHDPHLFDIATKEFIF